MLLSDRPNSSQLKSFSINGLFGFKDVEIPFDKEAEILIAENGSGKTTILNILYYSISCKFHKLSTVEFRSVVLKFASGVTVEIEKSDLNSFYNRELKTASFVKRMNRYKMPLTIITNGILEGASTTISIEPKEIADLKSKIDKKGNYPYFNRKVKVVLSCSKRTIISDLSQYADTPDCLYSYLEFFRSVS